MNMNSTKSSAPASSSYTRELRVRWAQQMNDHYIIYMTTRPSIFHVPKSISDTNPAAYVPQRIGLGPYHHFLPDLGRKADAAHEFLKEEKFKRFKSLIVDKVKGMEALIRSLYDEFLDLDCDTLGWIMAIDCVYLLHLLSKYPGKVSNDQIDANDRDLAKDILMLENQLPFQLLKEIRKAAMATIDEEVVKEEDSKKDTDKAENDDTKKDEEEGEEEDDDDDENEEEGEEEEDDDDGESEDEGEEEDKKDEDTKENNSDEELFREMLAFCKAHSPLDVSEDTELVYDAETLHLLSYLYRLIRYNWQTTEKPDDDEEATFRTFDDDEEITDNVIQTTRLVGNLTGQKDILFLSNLPLKQIFALFKKDTNSSSSVQEINIPSASQLHYVSKVELGVCPSDNSGGIGIKYLEEEGQRKLLLPVIKLKTESEVILRNLVAYEVQRLASLNFDRSNGVISGYVDFMCGLIDTEKDVELLKQKGIIVSDLLNPEIVKIFNGISKSDLMSKSLEEATEKLNLVYDSSFRVKAWKFVTDHFVPSQAFVRAFFAVLIVFLLSLQAFCQVYGCSSHWFRKMLSSTANNFIGHSDS